MANYTTDLTTMVDFDGTPTSPTVAEAASPWTAGRSPEEADTDFPIQSSTHASLTMNTTGKAGIMATNVSSFTWTSGDYIFGWIIWLAPGAIATRASGGLAMIVGDSVANCEVFYVGGSDYGSYPYGGWQNFVVDPELTSQETLGTAPSDFDFVGAGANVLSQVQKGNPLGFDVFRYGRGEFQVTGTGATFAGMATANDASTARWGLFQEIAGSYLWKGLMSLGLTATSVTFSDSNKSIVIDGVPLHVNSTFNAIEVNNASSSVTWTNISITSLNTVSPGTFEMVADATVNIDTCVFTDMSTWKFDSNATVENTTFRRCGQITLNDGLLDGCVIDECSAAVAVSNSSLDDTYITDCTFISDGTGHAIELPTEITADTSMDWKNYLSGYALQAGTAADRAIKVNVATGYTLTINVAGGYDAPTYYNTGGGTVSVVSSYTLTITNVPSGVKMTIVNSSTRTELSHQTSAGTDMTYAHSGGETVDIMFMSISYDPDLSNQYDLTLPSSNSSIKIQMLDDVNYENPT